MPSWKSLGGTHKVPQLEDILQGRILDAVESDASTMGRLALRYAEEEIARHTRCERVTVDAIELLRESADEAVQRNSRMRLLVGASGSSPRRV